MFELNDIGSEGTPDFQTAVRDLLLAPYRASHPPAAAIVQLTWPCLGDRFVELVRGAVASADEIRGNADDRLCRPKKVA